MSAGVPARVYGLAGPKWKRENLPIPYRKVNLASRKPPKPILRLRKCLIRSLYQGDAEALAREANNPEIARYMHNTFPQPHHIDDAAKWISIASSALLPRDFAICRLDKNTVIGGIGLKT